MKCIAGPLQSPLRAIRFPGKGEVFSSLHSPVCDDFAGADNHNHHQELQFLLFSHLLKTQVSANLVFTNLSWQRSKACLISPLGLQFPTPDGPRAPAGKLIGTLCCLLCICLLMWRFSTPDCHILHLQWESLEGHYGIWGTSKLWASPNAEASKRPKKIYLHIPCKGLATSS